MVSERCTYSGSALLQPAIIHTPKSKFVKRLPDLHDIVIPSTIFLTPMLLAGNLPCVQSKDNLTGKLEVCVCTFSFYL